MRRSLVFATLLLSVGMVVGQEPTYDLLPRVDSKTVAPVASRSLDMHYDPIVGQIIEETNLDSLVSFVRILSGEDPIWSGDSIFIVHRVDHVGNDLAADFLRDKMESYGLEIHDNLLTSSVRNVYALQRGLRFPEKYVIVSAHYDAVAEHCADDNASGVAAVLEASRILSQYGSQYSIIYASWDAEEIGLVGSRRFAQKAAADSMEIVCVVNLDMIGWDGDNDSVAEVHSPSVANSTELADQLVSLSSLYGLALNPVIYRPGSTASDHFNFWLMGIDAVLLIEEYYGNDLNPYYHSSIDRIDKFRLSYFHNMSKLSIAMIATLTGVSLDTFITSLIPDSTYQGCREVIRVRGVQTHFQGSGDTPRVWLSKGSEIIDADTVVVHDNVSITAHFSMPLLATLGEWDLIVETSIDGILTKANAFAILSAPPRISVAPDSLEIVLNPGQGAAFPLTLMNTGEGKLNFAISVSDPNGPVAYYPFNGNAIDESGYGNHGTSSGVTLTEDRFRAPNGAYLFGEYAYTLVPASATLDIRGDITVAAWVKLITTGEYFERIVWRGGDWGYHQPYSLYVFGEEGGDSVVFVRQRYEFDTESRVAASTKDLSWNQFHLLAATYSQSDSLLRLYIDGSLAAAEPASGSIESNTSTMWNIVGAATAGNYQNFSGIIDEVVVYGRALTDSEISGMTTHIFVTSDWLAVEPKAGALAKDSTVTVTIRVTAAGAVREKVTAKLRIACSDPLRPAVEVPINVTVSTEVQGEVEPLRFSLQPNYPNPFNPSTNIRFTLQNSIFTSLKVIDLLGREVATLVNEDMPPGPHVVSWDASGFPSGVYFCRLNAGSISLARKLLLVR